jgi:hypothetical protein
MNHPPDGTIRKVTATYRGFGVTNAGRQIEIDRYSKISDSGVSIAFIDTVDRFKGWKAVFSKSGAWAQYNSVGFGQGKYHSIRIRAISKTGATLQVRLNDSEGPIIAEATIPAGGNWEIIKVAISGFPPAVYNIVVGLKSGGETAVDYLQFE